jgi:hypothetical protein
VGGWVITRWLRVYLTLIVTAIPNSISLAGVAWLLAEKLAGRLYRGVRQTVGPIQREILMFPDTPSEHEDGMIGQIISA